MTPPLSALKAENIQIVENPLHAIFLPQYVKDLRLLLLNFKEIVPFDKKPDFEFLCTNDNNRLKQTLDVDEKIYSGSNHRAYQSRWEVAKDLRYKAVYLPDKEREKAWNSFMEGYIFQDIKDQALDQGIALRDLLSWGSEDLFSNAVAIRGRFSDGMDHQPKPDYWFGLGLYDSNRISRLQGLELKDKAIDYFKCENLKRIATESTHNFIYQPLKSRSQAAFPWMVVELKKDNGDIEECARQAANASYTCLKLCEKLAVRGGKNPIPIVAFTSVGPKAKVFITYKFNAFTERETYRMFCIWSGNVQHILHAVQLRSIVDQLMCWALRFFKPWVIDCLEHWYHEDSEDESEEDTEDSSEEESDGSSS